MSLVIMILGYLTLCHCRLVESHHVENNDNQKVKRLSIITLAITCNLHIFGGQGSHFSYFNSVQII